VKLPTATAVEQALLQELLLGEFFALTALVLGVLRIINLAHGESS
jgi:branched-subunit amino acid ABC-type transport system permease component